jgi:hypothetical protein
MLLLFPVGTVFATDAASDIQPISAPAPDTDSRLPEPPPVSYRGFTGAVKSIAEGTPSIVTVENSEGGVAEFIIAPDTYLFDGAKIAEGAQIIGFYDASLPMTMQYPPRYPIPVIAPITDEYSVFVGLFDENLVSADKQLALQNTGESKIISVSGEAYTGELTGRRLAVSYKIVTMSQPGQTTPIQIVVLPTAAPMPADVSQLPIVVNQTTINDPLPPYANESGVAMLPLRIVGEALGFDVHWDPAERVCTLGRTITVTADKDYYIYARTTPIELGTAPEIKDGRIYVPLSFFTKVAQLPTAEIQDGQIILTGPNP